MNVFMDGRLVHGVDAQRVLVVTGGCCALQVSPFWQAVEFVVMVYMLRWIRETP